MGLSLRLLDIGQHHLILIYLEIVTACNGKYSYITIIIIIIFQFSEELIIHAKLIIKGEKLEFCTEAQINLGMVPSLELI
jgi:hypothetical protein